MTYKILEDDGARKINRCSYELNGVTYTMLSDFRDGKSYRLTEEEAKKRAEELGSKVLNSIRDELLKTLKKKNKIKDYLLDEWMDARNATYPRYIKVTGLRTGAKVEDPMSNQKIAAIADGNIILSKIGNDSIGVAAGNKRIMKMRAKYESQKLASSIKFSGDPWK